MRVLDVGSVALNEGLNAIHGIQKIQCKGQREQTSQAYQKTTTLLPVTKLIHPPEVEGAMTPLRRKGAKAGSDLTTDGG